MLFTLEDIQAHFRHQDLSNGLRYAIDDRVSQLQLDEAQTELTAQVNETPQQPFYTRIEILGSSKHRAFKTACSCDIGHDCKHVAATMHHYLHQFQQRQSDAEPDMLTDWLQQLSSALVQPHTAANNIVEVSEYPDKVHNRLVYILSSDRHGHCLFVSVKSGRLLKEGRIGRLQPFALDFFVQGQAAPQYVLPSDERILRQLFLIRSADQRFRLQGEEGLQLLQQMLRTQRCFWKQVEAQPLRWVKAQEGAFQWQANVQGKQQLCLTDWEQQPIQVILRDPWIYLTPDQTGCGPIELEVPEHQARVLLDCPALAPEQVQVFNQQAHQLLKQLQVPLPNALSVRRLSGVKPVPGLLLESFHVEVAAMGFGTKQQVLVHTASLFYEYQDIRVMARDGAVQQRLHHLGELVEFERDLTAEAQLKQQLQGLQPVTSVYSSLIVNRLQKDQYSLPSDTDWVLFMVEQAPRLEAQGWRIHLENDFQFNLIQPDDWYGEIDEQGAANGWFNLELGVLINGQRVNLLPLIIQQYQANPSAFDLERIARLDGDAPFLLQMDKERIMLPIRRIRPILTTLVELFETVELTEKEQLMLPEAQVSRLLELAPESGEPLQWRGGVPLREMAQKLRDFEHIEAVPLPEHFHAALRPYQQVGLNWLQFLRSYGLAGVLADDMGLGKTVQALAHIQTEKNQGRMTQPCLVIAPTSLMFNWREEAAKFTPTLKVLSLHGQQRHQHFDSIADMDVVLTTYPLLVRDIEQLIQYHFHLLILDEAQIIKNPKAKAAQLVRLICANHRVCLTGTPMENHLGELWSLFDFLMPGFLGTEKQFNRYYRQPIEKHSQFAKSQALAKRIAPFLLRRRKQDVATELPMKTEIVRKVELEGSQRDLYETIRVAMNARIQQEIAQRGIARSQIVILDALLKLRQVCCDPRLLKLDAAKQVQESAKLELLMELLTELVEEGRRVLVFSQFTSMLAIIEQRLKHQKIKYVLLTGATRDRESPIRLFQSGSVPVFLISLKAGGTGLNLTAADTVIHYDPWWNPAVENQATDRAYRIGQDKPVFVYKLVSENTVEERIQAMQLRKQALAEGVYGQQQAVEQGLNMDDLSVLFEPIDATDSPLGE